MREAKIIQYLKEATGYCTKSQLAEQLDVSPRTISTDIKAINEASKNKGFQISHLRGTGYQLEVLDEQLFDVYFQQLLHEKQQELLNPAERKAMIALLLLFTNEYVTINQISETLSVSVPRSKRIYNN